MIKRSSTSHPSLPTPSEGRLRPAGRRPIRAAIAVVCSALSLARPAEAGLGRWTSQGPNGGQVAALAIAPSNPSVVYAGTRTAGGGWPPTSGDVYLSTDGGERWSSTGLAASIHALAVDPIDALTVYAATSEGLAKSIDGGERWRFLLDDVRALAIDPASSSTVYAGTLSGIYKSIDGGEQWTEASFGLEHDSISVLAIAPSNPSILYAGTYDGAAYRSTDGGARWVPIHGGLDSRRVSALAVDPIAPLTVYAGGDGLRRSTDGGEHWTALEEGLREPIHVAALAVDAGSPSTIYAGAGEPLDDFSKNGIFKSTDGGDSWMFVAGFCDGLADPWIEALAIDPANPATVYAGTTDCWFGCYRSDGIYKSTDGGGSWAVSNAGLHGTTVLALAIDRAAPPTLYGGVYLGGWDQSTDRGATWLGSYSELSIYALAVDPTVPSRLYVSHCNFDGVVCGMAKSSDGGDSWTDISPAWNTAARRILIDPQTPATLYAVSLRGRIYRSDDAGDNWIRVGAASGLAIDPSNPSTLYAGTDDGVFKTTDRGATWATTGTGLTGFVRALAVDPSDSSIVYAGTGKAVYKTLDGGSEWFAAATGMPETPVRSLAIDPSRSSTLYAATKDSVYKSADGAAHWEPIDAGLANVDVRALLIDPQRPSTLYAATNRGVWDITQVEPCVADGTTLCLNRDRFRIDVKWRDYRGNSGTSQVVPAGSEDSGLFWFFHPDNWEMLIKVLDGCALNDRFWVYAAATTDVGYTLRVTDTAVGEIRQYSNPLGTASPAITDTDAFATCSARWPTGAPSAHPETASAETLFGPARPSSDATESKGTCVPGSSGLCLNEDRFLVELEWRDYAGNVGSGQVVPLDSRDSGILWFFSENNWEMLIKVLDGCALNARFWVYAAATTDVEYRLRVTDLETGQIREYFNPLGTASPAITDTEAFAGCS